MTDTEILTLQCLAGRATPGPWRASGTRRDVVVHDGPNTQDADSISHHDGALVCESADVADRAYIAAAGPDVVAALCAELLAARMARDVADQVLRLVRINVQTAERERWRAEGERASARSELAAFGESVESARSRGLISEAQRISLFRALHGEALAPEVWEGAADLSRRLEQAERHAELLAGDLRRSGEAGP